MSESLKCILFFLYGCAVMGVTLAMLVCSLPINPAACIVFYLTGTVSASAGFLTFIAIFLLSNKRKVVKIRKKEPVTVFDEEILPTFDEQGAQTAETAPYVIPLSEYGDEVELKEQ